MGGVSRTAEATAASRGSCCARFSIAGRDHEFVIYGDRDSLAATDLQAPSIRIVHVRQNVSPAQAAAADGYRSPADMLRLTRAVWRDRPDVFWSPSVYTYFPLPPGLPALVTVHDTIADRFPELTMPTRRARLFWDAKVRLALWQATLVLTVSEFAASEIERFSAFRESGCGSRARRPRRSFVRARHRKRVPPRATPVCRTTRPGSPTSVDSRRTSTSTASSAHTLCSSRNRTPQGRRYRTSSSSVPRARTTSTASARGSTRRSPSAAPRSG